MTDYIKEVLGMCLEAFEFEAEQDVYNLKEEPVDKAFVDKMNKDIKDISNQKKEVEALTEEELISICNVKNEVNIEKMNTHNSEMITLKENLESQIKKVSAWEVEDKNLQYLKTCMINELLELLNYKCILMKPIDKLEPEKYKQDTLLRLDTKHKQLKNIKKDYITRVKEKNKMVILLNKHLPHLLD